MRNSKIQNSRLTAEKRTYSRTKPVFVVHRHLAGRLHYDFRLEAGGVLKSWAVPKGPSMNPADKRLAISVDDHPLDYKDFSGVIAVGYGAGIVEIWDHGTYEMEGCSDAAEINALMKAALKKGHAAFVLKGRKLRGRFAIVRAGDDEKKSWLLIKQKDSFAVSEKYDCEKLIPASSAINKELKKRKSHGRTVKA